MKKYYLLLGLGMFVVLALMPNLGQAVPAASPYSGFAPYCGDGAVNQTWEQCDGGANCSATCQNTSVPSCSDLALARVVVDEVKNSGVDADMTSQVFLGSSSNKIPAGAWFAVYENGSYITDADLNNTYEDVPGFAVQRGSGKVRIMMHGTETSSQEHAHGSIETSNIAISGVSDDISGNNKLEKGFDGNGVGSYESGDDEVWVDGAVAKFWLTTTTADDAFYVNFGSAPKACGFIKVCKMIADKDGNIVDGSGLSGSFAIADNGGSTTFPTTNFTLPLTLNTDIMGDSVNDAQCINYGLDVDTYFYGKETITGSGWMAPLYNDQYSTPITSLSDFYEYGTNNNANGEINLKQKGPGRTFVILNRAENQAPVITLVGSDPINLLVGGTFIDPGATANDPEYGDITASIVVGGNIVDTTMAGSYVITYDVSDSDGLAGAQVTRTVVVTAGVIPYSPYCGDGTINQAWEQCDGGANCSATCQNTSVPSCFDLVLARVVVDEIKNEGSSADMTSDVFLGSSSNKIPAGAWFATYWNGAYITDADLNTTYEDVPGFAVQRSNGNVRLMLHGTNKNAKEHAHGSIEADNIVITGVRDDRSGNNKLEKGFDGKGVGSYSAGNDEVWMDNGVAKFWLTVTTADDAFFADFGKAPVCAPNQSPSITLLGLAHMNLTVGDTFTDPGATASDPEDGDITASIVVGGDTVDTNAKGIYMITYNVTDSDGASAPQVTRKVSVFPPAPPSNQSPSITILGGDPINLIVGDTFTDPGATASDPEDGDITASIVVGGDTVDTNTIGIYVITYDVVDSKGAAAPQRGRTIIVSASPKPNQAPTINLIGSAATNLNVGDTFIDPGVVATDPEDGDITANVVVGGDVVDTSKIGTYKITYDVVDSKGAAAPQETRIVIVSAVPVPNQVPVITLLGDAKIDLFVGDTYFEPGFVANDPEDGDITANVVVTGGSIVTSTDGTFTITYDVKDSNGFSAVQQTRTVQVSQKRGGGGGGGFLRPRPTPQVLGAITDAPACGLYLTTFMKMGQNNDETEVVKLKDFLNEQGHGILPLTGTFGVNTFEAVKEFQLAHKDRVLAPWGAFGLDLNKATGYVYKTTLRRINEIMCPSLELPVLQLP